MSSTARRSLARSMLSSIPESRRDAVIDDISSGLSDQKCSEGTISKAELIADILHTYRHDNAYEELISFVVVAIEDGAVPTLARRLADICVDNDYLRTRVLEHGSTQLARMLDVLTSRRGSEDFPSLLLDTGHSEQAVTPDHLDCEDESTLSRRYLQFMTFVFRCRPALTDEIYAIIFKQLLALLGASSELAKASMDTLHAFFVCLTEPSMDNLPNSPPKCFQRSKFQSRLWARIHDLCLAKSSIKSMIYQIWLRWTALPKAYRPTEDILSQDRYWQYLQTGLLKASLEQRKLSLQILKNSLRMIQEDIFTEHFSFEVAKRQEYQTEYLRYCALFETITIGTYINQVEESLSELTAYMSKKSNVHGTWWTILLSASLGPGIPDGVRNLMGGWYMSLDSVALGPSPEYFDFIGSSFLPWAVQGHFFLQGCRKIGQIYWCEHGENLADTITRNIRACPDSTSKRALSLAALKFIHVKNSGSFPYADTFVVEGVCRGLEGQRCFEMEDARGITAIALRSDLLDVPRDLLTCLCYRLLECCKHSDGTDLSAMPGFSDLQSRWESLRQSSSTTIEHEIITSPSGSSLHDFQEELRRTNYKCFNGEGLLKSCHLVYSALNSTRPTHASELYAVLDALWFETERRCYPRPALLELPRIVFHPVCLDAAVLHTELRDKINEVMKALWNIAQGKIYVFPSFAKALHSAYFRSSEVVAIYPFEDFLVDYSNRPPSLTAEMALEKATLARLLLEAPGHDYSFYYGKDISYGHACVFDIVLRLRDSELDTAKRVLDRLIQPWTDQVPPITVRPRWKTTTQLQVMLILLEAILHRMDEQEKAWYIDLLTGILAIEPLPRYRFLLEWMIARIYVHTPNVRARLLDALNVQDHDDPRLLVSNLKVAVMVGRLPDTGEEFCDRLMVRLVPFVASIKVAVRHEAQWTLIHLWDHIVANKWATAQNETLAALTEYCKSLDKFKHPRTDRLFEWCDPIKDHTLSAIVEGFYLKVEPAEDVIVTVRHFEELWNEDQAAQNTLPWPGTIRITPGKGPVNDEPRSVGFVKAPAEEAEAPTPTHDTSVIPLQMKGTAWQDALLADGRRSTPLILVASLIDIPHNLGGLSRCAEVFGCRSLVLRSKRVLDNRQFTNVAVSSQLHLPMDEVDPSGLPAWLIERKREGYHVVGVEQTDQSLILGAEGTTLPEKTVLVLGSEREGIPAVVLVECDVCVEIKQVGVTRSLNVQTAASVALFEYARQHPQRADWSFPSDRATGIAEDRTLGHTPSI